MFDMHSFLYSILTCEIDQSSLSLPFHGAAFLLYCVLHAQFIMNYLLSMYLYSLYQSFCFCPFICFFIPPLFNRGRDLLKLFCRSVSPFLHLSFQNILTHLSWKLKWAFLIACCPLSVCPSVCLSVNFSHFHLLLLKHWASFNQTLHTASLGFVQMKGYTHSKGELVGK